MRIFLEIKQIKEWLELAKDNPRDFALFHLAFSTGLRISDLLSLTRSEVIDPDHQIVRVLQLRLQKTKQMIARPLRNDCREALFGYLQLRKDSNPYLFPPLHPQHDKNGPMHRMSAHRLYKSYLEKMFPQSMLAGVATHTPRRSMAKIISQTAGRIEPASRFLGHRSCASTAAYIDMDGHEQIANEIVKEIEL